MGRGFDSQKPDATRRHKVARQRVQNETGVKEQAVKTRKILVNQEWQIIYGILSRLLKMEIESRINYLGLISTIVFIIISLAVKFILRPQEECEKPTIYFHEDGKLNKEVIKNCKKLNEM